MPRSSPSGPLGALFGHGGLGVAIVDAQQGEWPPLRPRSQGVIRLGLHRRDALPCVDLDRFDMLLSIDPLACRPWVGLSHGAFETALARIQTVAVDQPIAAAVLAQILRMTLALPFDEALVMESMGYSMLLASSGFQQWRQQTPPRLRPNEPPGRVMLSRDGGALSLRLSRPESRNAFDANMRDELVAALEFALDDPEKSPVVLHGEGPCFSAGGDLGEFGSATDPGLAHAIRVLQSPARLVQALGDRLTVCVHGACIGAGIEAVATASRVFARPDAHFRLPEVSMGLIPGAGGTATIPRRIGRHRTCYLAISGFDIDASTALGWGLTDRRESGS
jgi:hypothetical protein